MDVFQKRTSWCAVETELDQSSYPNLVINSRYNPKKPPWHFGRLIKRVRSQSGDRGHFLEAEIIWQPGCHFMSLPDFVVTLTVINKYSSPPNLATNLKFFNGYPTEN